MEDISRREFLKYLGVGTVGLITKPKIPFVVRSNNHRASSVVQCFDENATSGSTINESVVQVMMDESIKTLTGIPDVGDAWKAIFPSVTENSIIGIKVNCINRYVATHPEFVNCIVNGLTQMEFGDRNYRRNNIIVWDRTDGELSYAEYMLYDGNDPDTVRCFGTDHTGVGYDTSCPLDVPGGPSAPSRILSQMIDYLINVAVLKNHNQAQVTLTMKNHYGSVSPVPSHNNYVNPGIPSLNQQIRDVVTPHNIQKIFIIDSLFGSILYGPGGSADCNPKKVVMSLDTVACDYQGWHVINEERIAHSWSPIQWPVYHIQTAEQSPYNLGTTDINLIEINNPTSIRESEKVEATDGLLQVVPNPFRKKSTVVMSLTHASFVYLDVINSSGRVESTIYKGRLSPGKHRISFTVNKKLPTGIYFIRLYNQGKSRMSKVIIVN